MSKFWENVKLTASMWALIKIKDLVVDIAKYGLIIYPTREQEWENISKKIIASEEKRIEKLLGISIDVPPLPSYITIDHWLFWRRHKFALRCLVSDIWAKPVWVLWDVRQIPVNNNEYSYDYLIGTVLQNLRETRIIKENKNPKSRYNLSHQELCSYFVLWAFAQALNVPNGIVRLPHSTELESLSTNFSPYSFDPERAAEWTFSRAINLPLNLFLKLRKTTRSNQIGFRIIVIFPPNKNY